MCICCCFVFFFVVVVVVVVVDFGVNIPLINDGYGVIVCLFDSFCFGRFVVFFFFSLLLVAVSLAGQKRRTDDDIHRHVEVPPKHFHG